MNKKMINLPEVLDKDFIHSSPQFKPDHVVMTDLNWKALIAAAVRGKNALMIGYTGSGKTTIAREIATVLNRPFFKIPLGSSQDPRATLIGNTYFHKDKGTYFKEAEFVKAIQTPHAIILLDEASRMHPEAENILMPVLDHQRCLKLDEHEDQITVKVAEGVCFIATANLGNEFTTARILDRATMDRYGVIIHMPLLSQLEELDLLKIKFPNVDPLNLNNLTNITHAIREDYISSDRTLENMVSTRMCESVAELLDDNFTLAEAIEITILPLYSEIGNEDSQRVKVKNIIDSILPDNVTETFVTNKISNDNIFANAAKKAGIVLP